MNKKLKLFVPVLCAAVLMSGCKDGNTPANETATAAPETTTAAAAETVNTTVSETTAASETTASQTTETVTSASETTAEPSGGRVRTDIAASDNMFDPETMGMYSGAHIDYETNRIKDEYIEYGLMGYSMPEMDKHTFFSYTVDPGSYTVLESDGTKETISIKADAADIYVRSSTGLYREGTDSDIKTRVANSDLMKAKVFPSAYNIVWDDPVAELTLANGEQPDYYDPVDDPEERRYLDVSDITLGWHTDDAMTVNAIVCDTAEGMAVLVDPVYMHGLPMFRDSETEFIFNGRKRINSDSLLFNATPVEGLSLDAPAYAYAQVTLTDVHCTKSCGKLSVNTCTVADIGIIETFADIEKYELSADNAVISSADKDPDMQMVYNAITKNTNVIINDKTAGIILLDLDFDGIPEVLVSDIETNGEEYGYQYKTTLHIYYVSHTKLTGLMDPTNVVEGDALTVIGHIPLKHMSSDNLNGFIGLATMDDGRKAWYINGFDDNDRLFTIEDHSIVYYPLFTTEGEGENIKYYYKSKEIVPEVTMGKDPYAWDDPNAPDDWEYLSWNGITATFGMWELFGFARANYANNELEESYPLYSDWLGEAYTGKAPVRYDLTSRELAHSIAYLVDDFYYGGTPGIDHYFWFLGAYAKPVIYLYPEEETDVSVKVVLPEGGELTCTYPEYGDGWNVTAMPDGTLYDADGSEYYCLYWEGTGAAKLDMSRGFCVAGSDTADFLREKLMYIGLTAREANEFIIYWLPKMQDNAYNIITLHTSDYAAGIPLDVQPAPDTQIRVFMTYRAADEPTDVPEQTLPHYERNGFTLVEWGGCETE